MLHFARPEYLYFSVLLIPAALLLWWFLRWYSAASARLGSPGMRSLLLPHYSVRRQVARGILFLAALVLLILGLANLQTRSGPQKGKIQGLDLVLAMDVSRSMMAEDIKPYRLERARQLAARLIDTLGSDRIGLVVFAGDAYVQSPLTSDHSSIRTFLDALSPDMVGTQGTAIGQAINQADALLYPLNSASPAGDASKVILIISDGETHDKETEEEAEHTVAKGATIYTVAVGRKEGAPIPMYVDGAPVGHMKDENGETIISKPDVSLMQRLARLNHGGYYELSEGSDVLPSLSDKLRRLKRQALESVTYTATSSHFQWFIAAGLLLLLLEYYLFNIRGRK